VFALLDFKQGSLVSGHVLTILLIAVWLLCRSWRVKMVSRFRGNDGKKEKGIMAKIKGMTADRKRMTAILARGFRV
jgi:hypothetical protein